MREFYRSIKIPSLQNIPTCSGKGKAVIMFTADIRERGGQIDAVGY